MCVSTSPAPLPLSQSKSPARWPSRVALGPRCAQDIPSITLRLSWACPDLKYPATTEKLGDGGEPRPGDAYKVLHHGD
jgi:hypothetical protein